MNDIIIIGAGIAGLTASIYARRAGYSVLILEGNIHGGQMVESSIIENYPGIPNTDGPELAVAIYDQATALGTQIVYENALHIHDEGIIKRVKTDSGEYEARCVIYAGGVKRRRLGCAGEDRLAGRGVSYCATCDGALYRGKTVMLVGGGNTALEDALTLSKLCEKVYIVQNLDRFTGDTVLAQAVASCHNIESFFNSKVKDINGERSVESATIISSDGCETTLDCDGVFVAIGMVPDTSILAGICKLDEYGYVCADECCETSAAGIFVAGDCRTKRLRQLVTAAADGANAASSAAKFLLK